MKNKHSYKTDYFFMIKTSSFHHWFIDIVVNNLLLLSRVGKTAEYEHDSGRCNHKGGGESKSH